MAKMAAGEAMARTLRASGVDHVFGIAVGSQASFTLGAIQSGMRFVTTRDEKCAALMAIAYGRVSGKPGVAIASNPGAAHLALGMYEAVSSGNAMVAIVSAPSIGGSWRPESNYADTQQIFAPVTKWTVRVDSPAALPEIARRALEVAASGSPGPVAVIVSTPVFAAEAEFALPAEGNVVQIPRFRVPPAASAVERAAELLLSAARPAIIAGGGVALSQAAEELLEVAELAGIPVATTHVAHGSFPGSHPLSVGVLGRSTEGNRGRIANTVVAEADVLLIIGTRMDAPTTRGYTLIPAATKIIQVDIDPEQIGRQYPVALPVVGDAKLALAGLKAALESRVSRPQSVAEIPRAREIAVLMDEWRKDFAPQMTSDAVPIKTPRLFTEVQKFLTDDTILVVDAGSSSYWAPSYLELSPANQPVYPRGAAAIGSGLPMALGAQLAAPNKRVICISGDGAFGYNVMELETAVRLNLPVVNIVVNNQNLGMERKGYLEYAGEVPASPVTFSPQNFNRIAAAFNCFGARVEHPDEIKTAIAAALASGRPAIVDVITDPEDSDSEETRPWRAY